MCKAKQVIFAHERPNKTVGWDRAIAIAQRQIAEARRRVFELELSISTFEEMRDRGEPFPGDKPKRGEATTFESSNELMSQEVLLGQSLEL